MLVLKVIREISQYGWSLTGALWQIVNSASRYEYRHGVHYIKTSRGMVYGITFKLPIYANPVATRDVSTDSGDYIDIP